MKTNSQSNHWGVRTRKIMLLPIVMLVAVGNLWAQQETVQLEEPIKQARWGIKGGINNASLRIESSGGESVETGSVSGFVAGVTLDYPFSQRWYLHSGLEMSMKGFQISTSSSNSLTVNATYLQVPVEVGYLFNIGKEWHIEPRLGIYLAYGLAGNTTVSGSSDRVCTFGGGLLKKFDSGVGLGCYFDNNKFIIGLHAEAGITEANGNQLSVTGGTVHNSNIAITVGYLF